MKALDSSPLASPCCAFSQMSFKVGASGASRILLSFHRVPQEGVFVTRRHHGGAVEDCEESPV